MKISLSNLLLSTTLIAICIVLFLTEAKLSVAEKNAIELRTAGGILTIDDPTQIHLKCLDCNIPNAWRYRIYAPEGTDQYLNFGTYFGGEEPESYVTSLRCPIPPGENLLTICFHQYGNGVYLTVSWSQKMGGTGFSTQLEGSPVFNGILSDTPSLRIYNENYPHGDLYVVNAKASIDPFPIIVLPVGVQAANTSVAEQPVGTAFWIGRPSAPKLEKRIFENQK